MSVERLTKRGNGYIDVSGVSESQIIDRLATYEDIGTPDEVAVLKSERDVLGKALEMACEEIENSNICPAASAICHDKGMTCTECTEKYYIQQAKEALDHAKGDTVQTN